MKIISLVCSWLKIFLLFCLLRHYIGYYFFEVFIVSLTVCCVNALFSAAAVSYIQGFQCFLRHCSVLCLDCSIFCLFNFVTSIFYLLRQCCPTFFTRRASQT